MRPSEIDYTSRVKHYFDISNGEVIAGEATQEYLQTCVDPDNVRELGELLCQPFLDIAQINYETLDSSNWSKEKYLLFGHWFKHIVPPPAEGHKQLTRQMLITGRKLGVVPPIRTLLREFGGKYGDFYVAIEASNTRTIGQFKDWALEDFVAYIRKVGGERMPTLAVFDNLHKSNPTKPSGTYMRDRFSNIGSFSKLLELAGYPVIGLWEKNDYTEWGVKFMQANNGIVPTAIMTDYFSFRRLGPSSTSIRNNFIRTGLFQREVGRNYTEHERKAQQSRQEKRDLIEAELSQGIIPVELFLPGNFHAGC